MGATQSRGSEDLPSQSLSYIFSPREGLDLVRTLRYAPDSMCSYRFVVEDQRKEALSAEKCGLTPEYERGVGCLLGLVAGDMLGAPLEFLPLRYAFDESSTAIAPLAGLNPDLWSLRSDSIGAEGHHPNRFALQMGQWTDDTSMALCMADSILANDNFRPQDLRMRFLCWWMLGYNNAFRLDLERSQRWGHRASVGLGGTIGESLDEFLRNPSDFTEIGSSTGHSSGNGSIMRNAPVPIMYRWNVDMAMEIAWMQSKTTHPGDEAADCARLLTWICCRAITSGKGKSILEDLSGFPARLYSTRCLAASEQEKKCKENEGLDLVSRDWRWRSTKFRYAHSRVVMDECYVGSYVMDCLAMSLHCVYVTKSLEDAVLRAANLCGDADTVAAVTGQLAGAMYGRLAIPESWQRAVARWDDADIFCRAWLLCKSGPQEPEVCQTVSSVQETVPSVAKKSHRRKRK